MTDQEIQNEEQSQIIVEQKESIKIIKNTKGYGYEVKLLEINLERLKEITDKLNKIYNIKNEN